MKKFGLLGEKLKHSFSKEIHELFYKYNNFNYEYELIEKKEEEILDLLENIRNKKYNGINITIPYKVEIIKCLDEISEEAKKIGAVNTIKLKNEKLIGYNTDYYGFLKTLQYNNIDINNSKALILGTGGAAKSVYNVLIDNNAEKIFLATLKENNNFKRRKCDRIIKYAEIPNIKNVDIVVNCTPVGMYPEFDNCPLEDKYIIESKYLIDLIYNPIETVLMKKYKLKGSKVINGLLMLIVQAIKSEEIWNDDEYSEEIYDYIYENLKNKLYI